MKHIKINIGIAVVMAAAILFVCSFPLAFADDLQQNNIEAFRTKSKEGWFWYQDPIKEEPPKKEKAESPKSLSSAKQSVDPWSLKTDEFKVYIETVKKEALDNPTEENILRYINVQDVARRKSLKFMNVYDYVVQKYPQYSMNADYPLADPGRKALIKQISDEKEDKLHAYKNDFGLIYFYSPTCSACAAMSPIVQFFIDKYGWDIRPVNIDNDQRLKHRFNVERVPHLLVLSRETGDYFPASSGVNSFVELEMRVYRSVRFLKNELTPEEWSSYNFQEGGAFDMDFKPSNSLTPILNAE